MNHHYKDIRDRLGPPWWWDERAVPRYCAFAPREVADIYAREAALVMIACQNCGRRFKVAFSYSGMDFIRDIPPLWKRIQRGTLHYGDPPNAGCCPAGPSMNSEPILVLEYWERDERSEWQRVSEREVGLEETVIYEGKAEETEEVREEQVDGEG